MEVKVLTYEQEKKILEYVCTLDTYDSGAARMVFNLDKELQKELGINEIEDCIIKIPMGIGGYRQTQLEVNTYLSYGSYKPLARIFAYGQFVEIMERVEPDDFRDFANEYSDVDDYMECNIYQRSDESDEHFEKRYNEIYEEVSAAAAVINSLEEIFGCTSDNGQLGKTRTGQYVSYDYGFTTDSSTDEQVSDICDVIDNDEDRNNYVQGLINLLNSEKEYLEHYEKVFLKDENGDGTYTRYEFEGLYFIPENQRKNWDNNKDYHKSKYTYKNETELYDDIKDAIAGNWRGELKAYIIYEIIYDLDDNVTHSSIVEVHIDDEYQEIWDNTKENE